LTNDYNKKIVLGKIDKMIKKIHFNRKKSKILEKYKKAGEIFYKYKRYQEAANAY